MKSSLSLLIPLLVAPSLNAYNLVKTWQGSSFFDDWNYIAAEGDTWTNGDVAYQSRQNAGNLTTVNSAGNAVIRVDDFSAIQGEPIFQKRRSIRLESPHVFNQNNAVLVYDVAHVPYGCSVWGSLWTKSGISEWPQGGEVDIFEAVNKMTNNQMALHTKSACTIAQTGSGQTGSVIAQDCQLHTNADGTLSNGSGCTVGDPSANSYSNFAQSNGGVWVAEYASSGVKIWFFERSAVPSGLTTAETLDTSTLGTPTANFPNSDTCDFSQALDPQHMVIDITLCGDWAGQNDTLTATCGALNTSKCYFQYVFDTNNYHEAYFEIASIKIFGDDSTLIANGTSTGSSPGSTPTTTQSWGSKLAVWTPLAVLIPAVLTTIFM